jgi:hypothetical protein
MYLGMGTTLDKQRFAATAQTRRSIRTGRSGLLRLTNSQGGRP